MNRELSSVPEVLINHTNEYCFESCMGMVLARFGKLGDMTLQDIVDTVTVAGEEYTPIERCLNWMESFGLRVTFIATEKDGFIPDLRDNGFDVVLGTPSIDMIEKLLEDKTALITMINHSGDDGTDNFELDHVAYIESADDDQVTLLDPDFSHPLVAPKEYLENIWGCFPNLLIFNEV